MSTLRKQIRKNIIQTLLGNTAAGDQVRENRGEPTWQENLPSIDVYFRGEPTITQGDETPRRMTRFLEMEVEIKAEGNDGEQLSDRLDDMAEQVERALSVDDSVDGCADDIVLTSVSEQETETTGSKPVGKQSLTFTVRYWTYNPRDRRGQGRFEDMENAVAEWDIQPGQDPDDRAIDDIKFP